MQPILARALVLTVMALLPACAPDPQARLAIPACTNPGVPVLLDARESKGTAGTAVARFVLDPGDGTPALVREDGHVLHTYAAVGLYTARVTVTDGMDRTARALQPVKVVRPGDDCGERNPDDRPEISVDVCSVSGVLDCTVDLGEVTVEFPASAPVRVRNVGTGNLRIFSYTVETAPAAPKVFSVEPPASLEAPAGGVALPFRVTMTPTTPGSFGAVLRLRTNAVNAPLPDGELTIQLRGVTPETPFARLTVDPRACDFGAVPYGTPATCDVVLRSTGTLAVVVRTVALLQTGVFSVRTPAGTVGTLQPGDERTVTVTFLPPRVGDFAGTLRVDSSDEAFPIQEVDLRGRGVETPPVASIRLASVNNLPPPSADRVRPLDDVEFTGADSMAGRPDRTVVEYRWSLVSRPDNSTVELTTPGATTTRLVFNSSFVDRLGVDVVGTYVLGLVVVDNTGVESAPARFTLSVTPDQDLLIQLTWLDNASDVDLHLVRQGEDNRFSDDDCYYANCRTDVGGTSVRWFTNPNANPRLDVDDVDGNGPENISIPDLADGEYTVGVHLYSRHDFSGTVTSRVQIFLGPDNPVLDETLPLPECNVWWDVASVLVVGGVARVDRLGTTEQVSHASCRE